LDDVLGREKAERTSCGKGQRRENTSENVHPVKNEKKKNTGGNDKNLGSRGGGKTRPLAEVGGTVVKSADKKESSRHKFLWGQKRTGMRRKKRLGPPWVKRKG